MSSEWWTFDPSLHGPMLLPTALTLMGSVVCVMSMSVLSSVGNTRGSYPLFKPGASSLGGSCVQVELSIQPKRLADCKGLTHEMEISVRSVCVRGAERGVVSTELDSPPPPVFCQDSSDIPSTVPSSSPSRGDQEVEEEEGEREAAQVERQRQLEAANLFDAALHIHQAALTKDTSTELGWVRGARQDWPGACSHLTVCCATLSSSASTYAVVHPHPLVERITTPCAPLVPRPSWNHHSKTKIPRELLDSHVRPLGLHCTAQQSHQLSDCT